MKEEGFMTDSPRIFRDILQNIELVIHGKTKTLRHYW